MFCSRVSKADRVLVFMDTFFPTYLLNVDLEQMGIASFPTGVAFIARLLVVATRHPLSSQNSRYNSRFESSPPALVFDSLQLDKKVSISEGVTLPNFAACCDGLPYDGIVPFFKCFRREFHLVFFVSSRNPRDHLHTL
jgi:hypothetical protein